MSTHHSFCRTCMNSCPMLVDVEGGQVVRVKGDPSNEIWGGYSCVKGRTEPALHNHPNRLLHPLKRMPDGTHRPISMDTAIREIADQLRGIIARSEPRAVAYYGATKISQSCLAEPLFGALLAAIGSPMRFSPNTIDKPGKSLALALHGRWMAPLQGYHEPDVALLIGTNPIKSYYGMPSGNPGTWLRDNLRRGMQLLVIDPRRTEVARRAHLHLRPRPGHDPEILACLINVVITEKLYDGRFVEENARGLEELSAAVALFTPEVVAPRAGVDAADLREIAVRFAAPARGYAVCGVGPGFAKSSTLVEYLTLVLETLTGHWLRAGEEVGRTPTLLPSPVYKAQAVDPSPAWDVGERMRIRGLTQTVAGLPVGALADEILLDGPGQVRALISAGGNPVVSWPDQERTLRALRSLDLLVQIDPWMSATAREAHYVIPPTLAYETPGMSILIDHIINMPTYYGPGQAWGQYTEALVDPPEGSDVVPEWIFAYELARELGLQLRLQAMSLTPTEDHDSGYLVDMANRPSAEELMEVLARGSRVPLSTVKQYPSGKAFVEPVQVVQPKDPGWTARFDLANPDMLDDLAAELGPGDADDAYPFRLVMVRVQNQFNSTLNDPVSNRGRSYNPAFMHPADLARLELQPGDAVQIRSEFGAIPAIVEVDADLLPGLVAMSFGYGGAPERDEEYRAIGSSPGRLLNAEVVADPHVGMPRIGNVPVSVTPAALS